MREVDVRGLSCPEPLMIVNDELKSTNDSFAVLISEAHTLKNIENSLNNKNIKFEVSEANGEYKLTVNR